MEQIPANSWICKCGESFSVQVRLRGVDTLRSAQEKRLGLRVVAEHPALAAEELHQLARAKEAQLAFKSFTQEKVDKIVKAMTDAGFTAAEKLAKMAAEETGFGKVADKKLKNEHCNVDGDETVFLPVSF